MTRRNATGVLTLALLLAACATNHQEPAKQPSATASASAPAPSSAETATTTTTAATAPLGGDPRGVVTKAHRDFSGLKEGKNAEYIPVLAKVDPKLYGITLITVDGAVYETGDVKHGFSIQSVSKVFTAARLLEDLGKDALEKKIGANATGQPFNSILAVELDKNHHPSNPFVNPGAIAAVSLVPAASAQERWAKINGTLEAFAGRKLDVDQQVYKSESETNTRNRAISWLLKAYEVIPGDPMEALDLYTRQCSVSVNAHDLAVMGATLANGGVNPITKRQVVSRENAARVLSLMLTAGLYETTGSWSLNVGVPAKSGVGGGIVAVVPGRYAIGTFSPPLDEAGNSVRGQKAIASIVEGLGGNVFMASAKGPESAHAAQRAER
jgi:glutaminase